jgi:antitoxin component HigA of HigAB toxin-antitoxin module
MIQRGISNSATELETAALVWALTKLPQYFDDEPFTVIMDQLRVKVNAPDKKYWETVSQIE